MSADVVVWTWELLDARGVVVGERAPDAHSRFDAETWLGEHWRAIAHRGAARAVLLRDGEPVGPGAELRGFDLRGFDRRAHDQRGHDRRGDVRPGAGPA